MIVWVCPSPIQGGTCAPGITTTHLIFTFHIPRLAPHLYVCKVCKFAYCVCIHWSQDYSFSFKTALNNLTHNNIRLLVGWPSRYPLGSHFRRRSRILKWGVNFCNNVIEPINIWGIRKKKKEGGSEKGGVPLDPRLHLLKKIILIFCVLPYKLFIWAGPIAHFGLPLFISWLKAWLKCTILCHHIYGHEKILKSDSDHPEILTIKSSTQL